MCFSCLTAKAVHMHDVQAGTSDVYRHVVVVITVLCHHGVTAVARWSHDCCIGFTRPPLRRASRAHTCITVQYEDTHVLWCGWEGVGVPPRASSCRLVLLQSRGLSCSLHGSAALKSFKGLARVLALLAQRVLVA